MSQRAGERSQNVKEIKSSRRGGKRPGDVSLPGNVGHTGGGRSTAFFLYNQKDSVQAHFAGQEKAWNPDRAGELRIL